MNIVSFHKTRIAPTPSGYLHIGNAMSFLLTAALVKQVGAKLLLRIDDIDKERVRKEYVEDIFETLHFLEIEWKEGPDNYKKHETEYSQRHRLQLYETALQQLRNENKIFACACSRKELLANTCCCYKRNIPLDKQNVSWRLITDNQLPLTFNTINGEVFTGTLPASMQSFLVRKKDGYPAYQLASLIDDEYFGVDAIVRGADLWNSTLAQQYLALQLGKAFFKEVLFYHHPLITDGNGKLSKSAGSASVKHLRSEGKNREDVLAMLTKWLITNKDDQIISLLYNL